MKAREARIPAASRKWPAEARDRIIALDDAWGDRERSDGWKKTKVAH